MCNATDLGKLKLFADDSNLFLSSKNLQELELKENKVLENILIWCAANKLSVNIDKTTYMIIHKQHRHRLRGCSGARAPMPKA